MSGGVLHDAFTDVLRDTLLYRVANQAWDRGGDGDQEAEQNRDDDAGDGDRFQGNGDGRIQQMTVEAGAQVGDGLNPVQDRRGQEEGEDGERGDGDEEHVDGAREVLAAPAVSAVGEVLVVVGAHCGRQAGDVVAPAGENVADEGIRAMEERDATRSGTRWERFHHGVIDIILIDLIARCAKSCFMSPMCNIFEAQGLSALCPRSPKDEIRTGGG